MVKVADLEPDRVRPLLRVEYDRLVESGAFDEERVELIEGMLVTTPPQDAAHAFTVQRLAERLLVALQGRAIVRVQSPIALAEDSEPEPDIAVVPSGDYSTRHPAEARLLVEVATTSLRRDRFVKAPLYARAGVEEYWIVDVASRSVHVHSGPSGTGFADVSSHGEGGVVRPLSFPDVEIDVRSVLPTPK